MNYLNLKPIIVCVVFMLITTEVVSQQREFTNNRESISPQTSSYMKIENAFQTSEIDINDWALFVAYALFDRNKLPSKYYSSGIEKCGTWIFDKIHREWDNISSDVKQQLLVYGFGTNGILLRPSGLSSSKSTDHFKIHYSVAAGDSNAVNVFDGNTNGTPDYIDTIAETLENVWDEEITTMNYTVPPPDGTDGGDLKYDVYVYKLASALLGAVQPEFDIGDNPNSTTTEKHAATSYMILRNNYDGFYPHTETEFIQVTSAHEFFHSIQKGYDLYEKIWLNEATSAWIEDEIYDDINVNYRYMAQWFLLPWVPLDADNSILEGHWYGSWIFFRYLSEHVGGQNTIKTIWENSITHDSKLGDFSFEAVSGAIVSQGTTFSKVFSDFTVANLLRTVTPYKYEEGEFYPDIDIDKIVIENSIYDDFLSGLSSRYYEISPNYDFDGQDEIKIIFKKLDILADFSVQVAALKNNIWSVNKFFPGDSLFTLNNSEDYDKIYVIIANNSKTGITNTYKLEIQKNSEMARISQGFFVQSTDFALTFGDAYGTKFIVNNIVFTIPGSGRKPLAEHTNDAVWQLTGDIDTLIVFTNNDFYYHYYRSTYYDSLYGLGLLGCDKGYAWLARNKIYRFNMSTKKFELISNIEPSTISSFDIDNLSAAWVNEWYIYPDRNVELWLYKNESTPERLENLSGDNVYLDILDFKDNILVWTDLFNYLKYKNVQTNTASTLQTGKPVLAAATDAGRIAWVQENDQYSTDVYLFENNSTEKLFSGEWDSYIDWVSIDSFGVVWYQVDPSPAAHLSPTFYYYDFERMTTSSISFADLYIREPSSYRGANVSLNNKALYFSATKSIDDSTPYSVYKLKLDKIMTDVHDDDDGIIYGYKLSQNYPNPFNPTTTIKYGLPFESKVKIEVYNILGQRVGVLVNKVQKAGNYRIEFNGNGLTSGLYFYRIQAGTFTNVKKMLLIK